MAFQRIQQTSEGRFLVLVDPSRGEEIGTHPVTSAGDVAAAAREIVRVGRDYGELSSLRRSKFLMRLCSATAEQGEELAECIVRETGKPLAEAWTEVLALCETLRYYARETPAWLRPPTHAAAGRFFKDRRVEGFYRPVGAYACITSWDFPLFLPGKLIAQLLAGGNTVLWKPSPHVPLTARLWASVIEKVAPSPGVPVRVVFGGASTGEEVVDLVREGAIDEVAFCGQVEPGREVVQKISARLGDPILALGGSNPMVVLRDADVELAARAAVTGALYNGGQSGISIHRIFVHQEIHPTFVETVERHCRDLALGEGVDPATDVGAMISLEARDNLLEQIHDALENGASLIRGGAPPGLPRLANGFFMEPTILDGCDGEMRVFREPTCGPVLPIHRFESYEEAVALANENRFGLSAAVFGNDPDLLEAFCHRILSGTVYVNDVFWSFFDPSVAWEGWKDSGRSVVFGREGFYRTVRRSRVLRHRAKPQRDRGRFYWFRNGPRKVEFLRSAIRSRYGAGKRFSPGLKALAFLLGSNEERP